MGLLMLPSLEAGVARGPRLRPTLTPAGWLVCLGLALRLVHYIWNHTIWYDEACLLFNILGKGYGRLLGPLDYEVAAPPLFLWGLRTVAVVFGDHPYVWRFPLFLISCLQLVLMASLARRVLRPAPAALLIGLVAFSDGFIWLGCNVKPYILDAFLATGLLYAYVRSESWPSPRRILAFAAAFPLLACFSYPTVFMYAGLLLAFLPLVWRQRRAGPWLAYLGLVAVMLATLTCLYLGPIRAQRVPGLMTGWMNKFPNLSAPASVPGWVLGNTFLVFHYCYNPIGAGCVLIVGVGVWWCLRNRRLDLVCVCLGPVAVTLLAAFVRAYPYSNNRLILFAAPGIGVMTGLGLTAVLDRWRTRPGWAAAGWAAALILPEVVLCLMHLTAPWDYPDGAGSTRFVKQQHQLGDLVAITSGSRGATFAYFFFGETHPLEELSRESIPAGRRVWVMLDRYSVVGGMERSRAYVLSQLPPSEWELRSETRFYEAGVFLLVRRAPCETPPAETANQLTKAQ